MGIYLDAVAATTPNTLEGIFAFIAGLFQQLVSAAGTFVESVFASPVFTLAFLLPLAGIGISFARKLLSSTHA